LQERKAEALTESQRSLIISALSQLFFGDSTTTSSNNIDFILNRVTKETYPKDATVVKEGDDAMNMYIVEEGTLRVTIEGKNIRDLKEGDFFGELALLFNGPRGATIKTLSTCTLWSVFRDDFRECKEC